MYFTWLFTATGTGKSLSMICGSLSWLRFYEENRIGDLNKKIDELRQEESKVDTTVDDWITAGSIKNEIIEKTRPLQRELDFLLKKIEKIKDLRKRRERIQQKENHNLESDFDQLFHDAKQVQDAVKKELSAMKSGFDPGRFSIVSPTSS